MTIDESPLTLPLRVEDISADWLSAALSSGTDSLLVPDIWPATLTLLGV